MTRSSSRSSLYKTRGDSVIFRQSAKLGTSLWPMIHAMGEIMNAKSQLGQASAVSDAAHKLLGPSARKLRRMRAVRSSNVGKWSKAYRGLAGPEPYDDTMTYGVGVEFLSSCSLIEDWGCGKGWLRTLVTAERYRGIDGTATQYTDAVADLVDYRSQVPAIFMRHILEHNYRWPEILDNALASFAERMVLILFTPVGDRTREIAFNASWGVPDISFKMSDITDRFGPDTRWQVKTFETNTQYSTETVFFLSREPTSTADAVGHSG